MWHSREGREEDFGFEGHDQPVKYDTFQGRQENRAVGKRFLNVEEMPAASLDLAIRLLKGEAVVTQSRGGNPYHVEYEGEDFSPGQIAKPVLTDLRLLAIEVLKDQGATDPDLARAFLDEAMAQLGDEDRPVTREWLEPHFTFLVYESQDLVFAEQIRPMFRLTFQFRLRSDEAHEWGFEKADESFTFPSAPTRRKVMAFCHATGIQLTEKS